MLNSLKAQPWATGLFTHAHVCSEISSLLSLILCECDLAFPSVRLPESLSVHTSFPSWVVIECEVQSGAVEVTSSVRVRSVVN